MTCLWAGLGVLGLAASVNSTAFAKSLHRDFERDSVRGATAAKVASSPQGDHSDVLVVGTVSDNSGRPLPNVQVIISSLQRTTTTDRNGRFTFGELPPNRYELRAVFIGYSPTRKSIEIVSGQDSLNVAMVMARAVMDVDPVHITASPHAATTTMDVSQSTVELSGQTLARSVGSSVAKTLETQPGLASRYNGPVASTPVIRGLSGDRVLVLQNGERSGDLSSSASDHALTIDPLAAERIEVVRGPASLLYGSNAIGGVVNVIENTIPTNIPTRLQGYFATQGESVNPGASGSASLSMPLSSLLGLNVRANYRNSSDTRQGGGDKLLNSFARQGGGAAGLGFVKPHMKGGLSYEALSFTYGLPGDVGDPELGARIRGTRQQVVARSDFDLHKQGITFVQLNTSAQWYAHDEVEDNGEVATKFNLKTQTGSATARTAIGAVHGAFGFQGLLKQYAASGEEALTPAANSTNAGLFVFQDIPLLNGDTAHVPHLHVGARYDLYRITSKLGDPKFGAAQSLNFHNTSGSVGLVFPLVEGVSINGNVSRAFRAPTVEELFSNAVHAASGTYDIGNPNLKAETNNGAEIVLRAQKSKIQAQLSSYYNRVNNYVTSAIAGDTLIDGKTIPLNLYAQGDATLKGFEGNVDGAVTQSVVVGVMGDLVRGALKNGQPLPFMPPARIGTHVRYDNGTFSLGADHRYGFRQNRVPVAVSSEDPSAVATAAYNLVNLSAGYRLIEGGRAHSITLRVDNLFDEQYKDATSRIKVFAFNPGRNVSLIYKVLF